jgi:GntR family transcriptional repressor for pyruvate dehydrogenase complex
MTEGLAFKQIERSTAAAQVADRIRQTVLGGGLRPGDRLPPEHRLAETFGVSRVVVREALKELQGAGLVDSPRRGRDGGPIVLGVPAAKAAEVLRDHLRLHEVPVSALVEFRVLVESGAARWAAQRRSETALDKMRSFVERMEEGDISWDEYHELDVAFHLGVIEASQNPCAVVVMRAIREAMSRAMIEGFRRADARNELREAMVAEHRRIYETIADGRDAEAERIVGHHILDFYGKLFPSELRLPG